MKAHLFNEKNYLEAVFILDDNQTDEEQISGEIQLFTRWDLDKNPVDKVFFSYVKINWNGESEFQFLGQDLMEGIKDSNYSLKGVDDYLIGMKLLNFAYQVMIEYFGGEDKIFESDEIYKLNRLELLRNHTIKYS